MAKSWSRLKWDMSLDGGTRRVESLGDKSCRGAAPTHFSPKKYARDVVWEKYKRAAADVEKKDNVLGTVRAERGGAARSQATLPRQIAS